MQNDIRPKHWPKSFYDPHCDPLVDRGPGHNRDYAPTYWIGTAGAPPADEGPVSGDVSPVFFERRTSLIR